MIGRASVRVVLGSDGSLRCGFPDCVFITRTRDSLRGHARKVHKLPLQRIKPTPHKLRNRRWWRRVAASARGLDPSVGVCKCGAELPGGGTCQKRAVGTKGASSRCSNHPVLTVRDAQKWGVLGARKAFVEVLDTGTVLERGVFARKFFRPNDIITQYCSAEVDLDVEGVAWEYRHYIVSVAGLTLPGIMNPKRGQGLGSFVNSPCRVRGAKQNTRFCRQGNGIFVKATRPIAVGEQLFLHYGSSYRLPVKL